MGERIPSDHPSLTTVDATVERRSGTDRPVLTVPESDAASFPDDEVVRLVMDDTEYRALVRRPLAGEGREIAGAYDTPSLARSGDGENRLLEWFRAADTDFGRTVHLDVIEAGFAYGLRLPGHRSVYDATESPNESLAAIARDLDGE